MHYYGELERFMAAVFQLVGAQHISESCTDKILTDGPDDKLFGAALLRDGEMLEYLHDR